MRIIEIEVKVQRFPFMIGNAWILLPIFELIPHEKDIELKTPIRLIRTDNNDNQQ